MPFIFKKILDHGASNPIVARLIMQTLEIIKFCDIAEHTKRQVVDSIEALSQGSSFTAGRSGSDSNRSSVRQWRPRQRSLTSPTYFALRRSVVPSCTKSRTTSRPAKVFNLLYGTNFKEAREFSRPKKKGGESLVKFASNDLAQTIGEQSCFKEAVGWVEYSIDHRNAVEHPGGYSGELVRSRTSLEIADGKAAEPVPFRVKGDVPLDISPSSICADMDLAIHKNLH